MSVVIFTSGAMNSRLIVGACSKGWKKVRLLSNLWTSSVNRGAMLPRLTFIHRPSGGARIYTDVSNNLLRTKRIIIMMELTRLRLRAQIVTTENAYLIQVVEFCRGLVG